MDAAASQTNERGHYATMGSLAACCDPARAALSWANGQYSVCPDGCDGAGVTPTRLWCERTECTVLCRGCRTTGCERQLNTLARNPATPQRLSATQHWDRRAERPKVCRTALRAESATISLGAPARGQIQGAAQPAIAADAAARRQDRSYFGRWNQLERHLDLSVRRS